MNKEITTIDYEPNTNFIACSCDATLLTCDAFCCCDQDCSQETKDVWVSEQKCRDVDYRKSTGLPLQDCVSRAQIYDYNKTRGISNYIDPFAQLFCVKLNWSPKIGYYYHERTDELTPAQLQTYRNQRALPILLDTNASDEVASALTSKSFYSPGQKMRSELSIPSSEGGSDAQIEF